MKEEKNLLSRMMIMVVLPVAFVFCVTAGFVIYIVSQNVEQFSEVQSSLLLISAIGLAVIVGVIALGLRGISEKVAMLYQLTGKLVNGKLMGQSDITHPQDQLEAIQADVVNLAKTMQSQADAVKSLADGDLSYEIVTASGDDSVSNSLLSLQKSLIQMVDYFNRLPGLAENRIYEEKDVAWQLPGAFNDAVSQVEQAIEAVAADKDYYLAVLDAIPYRIMTTDKNMKMVFINKMLEDLKKLTGAAEKRADICGLPCNTSNLEMCGNENCGVAILNGDDKRLNEQGFAESSFFYRERCYRMDTAHLIDKNGEKIGYVEIAQDTTPLMSVNNYSRQAIEQFADNLHLLSEGTLDLDLNLIEPDQYSAETYEQFKAISESFTEVKSTISSLIEDAIVLTTAAMQGNLETRVDEKKFSGSWQEVIAGMNGILQVMAKPLEEVAQVMEQMAQGHLDVSVNGFYQGSFETLKEAVNTMGSQLKTIVTEISIITGEISNGNLNLDRVNEFGGDFDTISNALNSIIKTLNALLSDINNASDQVSVGANQVSDSSQSLAQGSTQQASSIQELTASISEIADQTKNNAVNANKVKELARDVMTYADKGNHHMSEMQRSMTEINQASENISKIIKVIDDIAFQTNILALNAAVEAARAGQHGKGFAVVAEEVRTLAARSADAAKETTGLIEGSISKVAEGTKIANDTAEALEEIVDGVAQVNDLIGNIATASNEQATGIVQINMGVEQVAQVVQKNSATAEESAAASEELSSQSVLLKQMIDQFQLR